MVCVFAGCVSLPGDSQVPYNLMITERTGFFKAGPYQGPPDRYLQRGDKVRRVSGGGDFMEIETTSKERGFVSTSAVGAVGDAPEGHLKF